jgi:DUF4097 and DUF4098 domain-containing protein YvlB
LKTFSGDIIVDATAADAAPRLTAETFSGDIRVRLADSAKGDVNFKSFSGRFDTELPLTLRSADHKRVSGSLPGATDDSTLRFTTFSGDVQVTK